MEKNRITFRNGDEDSLAEIIIFVDYWLSGRGRKDGVSGVSNDYFVSAKQQFDYVKRYCVLLAFDGDAIVGWAVKNQHHVLIHLLVSGDHRGQGIGKELIKRLNPEMIRSKMDQSTGDPCEFYMKVGFVKVKGPPLGRKGNIELYVRKKGGV